MIDKLNLSLALPISREEVQARAAAVGLRTPIRKLAEGWELQFEGGTPGRSSMLASAQGDREPAG